MIKPKHIAGNLPLIGRYVYPLHHKKSIFAKPGWYYPKVHSREFNANAGKIVVFGLPKSGNTWIVGLLSDYLDLKGKQAYGDRSRNGITMLHDPLSYRLKIRSDFQRGVYIMRDLRDIVVSYYHYVQTDYYKELNDPYVAYPNIEDFYTQYFLPKLVHRYNWYNHANNFLAHGLPLVKYEDLCKDTVQAFSNLLVRMGLPLDVSKVEEVVEKNNIAKLSKSGKDLWHKVPKAHFRKGGYGGYKDEMSQELITRINKDFELVLGHWGYLNR